MKTEILRKIEKERIKIINYLLSATHDKEKGLGLHTGVSGQILFLSQIYLENNDENIQAKIYSLLDYGIECIDKGKHLYPTFSSGLAGFTWVVDHLLNNNLIDESSEEILEVLEPNLYKDMLALLGRNNFDLLNGAMGIAIYFLKRKKHIYIEAIINYLNENKIENNDELVWIVDKRNPGIKPVIDFSLAHGMAGILYFLSRCYTERILEKKCEEMIRGILKFFNNHEQDFNKVGSFYPNTVDAEVFFEKATIDKVKSRVAWCYGDLGILTTLRNTHEMLNDRVSSKEVTNKLLLTSERILDSSVNDAGFCHGSCGNAFLFNDLYLKTGNLKFKEASLHWIKQTLEFNREINNDALDYVLSSSVTEEYEKCDGLLEGISGVGFVYTSFLNKNLPYSMDAFMLT